MVATTHKPVLIVIAGPNGSGKTTNSPFPLSFERDFRFCMSCCCIISSDFYSFSSGMYT